jgi:hypothetical protein
MQSLFLHPDNQTLLWEVMQTCPFLVYIDHPDEWFQSHMQKGYENSLSEEGLMECNQRVVRAMMSDLRTVRNMHNVQKEEVEKQQWKQQEMRERVDKDSELKTDTTKDEPIKNMEELLAEHEKRRAQEIPQFPTPTGEVI